MLFSPDKTHKLSCRNLQLSLVLPEKKTQKPTHPVFVIRAYDTFGEPGSVFTETVKTLSKVRFDATYFMHLWFKLKVLELGSSQQ